MECKYCKFYTGRQTHGHGECWGSCMLFEIYRKVYPHLIKPWSGIRDDDDECIFKEYLKAE